MMTTGLSYRRSAIEGASPIGLMIALFDTLAGDLGRAAAALRKGDIETRCREVNHAILVLGHLESWIDRTSGGESAESLARFYGHLRAKMMEASVKKSATILDAQIEMILNVRSAWQLLDIPTSETLETPAISPADQSRPRHRSAMMEMPDRIPFSQSA
jgi:flagellar protein FliS